MNFGYGPMYISSESDRECAGSVDTSNVFLPLRANHNAVDADTEVLPTPPFPPTNTKVVSSFLKLNKSLNAITIPL